MRYSKLKRLAYKKGLRLNRIHSKDDEGNTYRFRLRNDRTGVDAKLENIYELSSELNYCSFAEQEDNELLPTMTYE